MKNIPVAPLKAAVLPLFKTVLTLITLSLFEYCGWPMTCRIGTHADALTMPLMVLAGNLQALLIP